MARPTGVFKRSPEIGAGQFGRYAKLSKADWAEAFFDLYREAVGGEAAPNGECMADAERRVEILRGYREAEAAAKERQQ